MDARISLLRVELDDELFLDRQTNVFTFGKVIHRTEELIGGELQPRRDAAATGRLDGLADLFVLAALLADLNRVSLADLVGGDVGLSAVHLDVAVADELACLGTRCG